MIFFSIFISIIVVAGSEDGVAKFAAANAKISIVNIFLTYDTRPITKNFNSSVTK
jgi:hypothetical protein